MATHPFHRNKMIWLNAICKDCGVSATAFRIAYFIADHLNSISGDAWPSHNRIASKLCITTKTVQRASRELERSGWLKIQHSRSRRTTNRYRPCWPDGNGAFNQDNSALNSGNITPNTGDENVPQSYLANLLRTSLRGHRGQTVRFPDRGLFEQRIVRRFGSEAEELLTQLDKHAPDVLNAICVAEKQGDLTLTHVQAARLYLQSLANPER